MPTRQQNPLTLCLDTVLCYRSQKIVLLQTANRHLVDLSK